MVFWHPRPQRQDVLLFRGRPKYYDKRKVLKENESLLELVEREKTHQKIWH